MVGLIGTGVLVARYGWASSFYVFGVAGIAWAILWWRVVHNDPATDPHLAPAERALLAAAQPAQQAKIPLGRLLLRLPVTAIVVSHVAVTWGLYMLLSWLPSYFREAQGLSIANAGLFSAAPWLAMLVVSNVAATLTDRMILRG